MNLEAVKTLIAVNNKYAKEFFYDCPFPKTREEQAKANAIFAVARFYQRTLRAEGYDVRLNTSNGELHLERAFDPTKPLAHLAPHSMDNDTVNEVFDALEKGLIKP